MNMNNIIIILLFLILGVSILSLFKHTKDDSEKYNSELSINLPFAGGQNSYILVRAQIDMYTYLSGFEPNSEVNVAFPDLSKPFSLTFTTDNSGNLYWNTGKTSVFPIFLLAYTRTIISPTKGEKNISAHGYSLEEKDKNNLYLKNNYCLDIDCKDGNKKLLFSNNIVALDNCT